MKVEAYHLRQEIERRDRQAESEERCRTRLRWRSPAGGLGSDLGLEGGPRRRGCSGTRRPASSAAESPSGEPLLGADWTVKQLGARFGRRPSTVRAWIESGPRLISCTRCSPRFS
jgi:hypothetical protein